MRTFRIMTREDVWTVYNITAQNEDEARREVESSTTKELEPSLVDSGCNFCGIESVEEIKESQEPA